MFTEQKKKQLIIVCTEKTRKYANFLIQLIGMKDDTDDKIIGLKDDSVEAAIWSEKNYKDNLPTIKSSTNILFIGNSKMIEAEIANMQEIFNSYGMHFKSLGCRAAMYVENKRLSIEDYRAFEKFCSEYHFETKDVEFLNALNSILKKAKKTGIFAPIIFYPAVGVLVFGSMIKDKETTMNQQYSFLMLYSYKELLPKFLEDNA